LQFWGDKFTECCIIVLPGVKPWHFTADMNR
jgi:hypothetical protein